MCVNIDVSKSLRASVSLNCFAKDRDVPLFYGLHETCAFCGDDAQARKLPTRPKNHPCEIVVEKFGVKSKSTDSHNQEKGQTSQDGEGNMVKVTPRKKNKPWTMIFDKRRKGVSSSISELEVGVTKMALVVDESLEVTPLQVVLSPNPNQEPTIHQDLSTQTNLTADVQPPPMGLLAEAATSESPHAIMITAIENVDPGKEDHIMAMNKGKN